MDGRDIPIPMGRPESETISTMNAVGIIIWLTRLLWSNGKAVITDRSFCVLRGILEMRKRGIYGSALIKIDAIGLGGFTETVLTSTPVKKMLVMLDVLVVNGMGQSLIIWLRSNLIIIL